MSEMRGKIWVTTNMTGKMHGLCSISTSCLKNGRCKARALINGSICAECYARGYLEFRKGCRDRYGDNYDVLNAGVLEEKDIPRFYESEARIEAFGETDSVTQAKNYLLIPKANPKTEFGWFSKNSWLTYQAIHEGFEKPKNLTYINSSLAVNESKTLRDYEKEFTDIIFTAYTLDYLKEHPEIVINCGLAKCEDCKMCYGRWKEIRENEHDILYVNEIVKADRAKYKKWIESRRREMEEILGHEGGNDSERLK